ncbi:MAG: hypothetical protein ICV72_07905 [Aldersonia sp.]|nr:hypothetical protein [Aldersonia sp.]
MPDPDDKIAAPAPSARPQRVGAPPAPAKPPRRRVGRWLAAVVVALLVIAALVVGIVVFANRANQEPTAEELVRASVDTYSKALSAGDLATLRRSTCGPLADYYRTIPDDQFRQVYGASAAAQSIPVVASIDAVQVNEQSAIAQVTAFVPNEPASRSARTLDLQQTPEGWKVCEPPA